MQMTLSVSTRAVAWTEVEHGRSAPLLLLTNSMRGVGFSALAPGATGLLFTNTLSDDEGATNRTLYNGAGVATGDVDGDGLADIVLAGIRNQLALFKNLGGFRFTNATLSAGLRTTNQVNRGVVLADVTGDGALDLLLSANGRGVQLWKNDGQGRFSDATSRSRTASPYGSMTMTLADIDGNGSLDLYVGNNRTDDIRDRGSVDMRMVGGKMQPPLELANRLVVFNGQIFEYGEPDVLLLNDGAGNFRPANWSEFFANEQGAPFKQAPLDWALSATFRDLNNDGAPDLYVCNDFWTPDRIWFNDGKGRFKAAPTLAFRQISGSSMGVDMADLDGNGRPEIFVVDMLSRLPSWRKRQLDAQAPLVNAPGVITNRPQSLRNTFFLAHEDGAYSEIANYAGVAAAEWAWQPIFIDVDLDGLLDLLVTSGHAHDVQDRDAEALVRSRQRDYSRITNPQEKRRLFTADQLESMKTYPPLETPIVAFRNKGDFRFEDVTRDWGTDLEGINHGIATADFDGDGDLDFVVNNLNSPATIFRNETPAARVAVRLKGSKPNTQAIGAKVTLRGGVLPAQTHEVIAGGRYLSGSDPLLMFAAGNTTNVLKLEVKWRSGKISNIEDVAVNRLYEIDETKSGAARPHPSERRRSPLFTEVSHLLSHTHSETYYDDFARQPLLPWRLSQTGPHVAWADLNGDGWEDLVIGAHAGGPLSVFYNREGAFERATNAPFATPLPRETSGMVHLPGRGLIVGLSNYEDGRTNGASLFTFAPNAPGPAATLPDVTGSVGPLAASDYDNDGDVDLFLGIRTLPAQWPRSSPSVLLKNDGQAWTRDVRSNARFHPESVNAAVWADLNKDGSPELVTAGDFSPLRLFRNEGGALSPWNAPLSGMPGCTNINSLTGLWQSLAAADFDNDGRIDLLLGNWGENGDLTASPEKPFIIFAADVVPGSLSLMETTWDTVRNALTARRPLNDLTAGFPQLAGAFATHREFSEKTAEELLAGVQKAQRFSANTLRSLLLLNRHESFEAKGLAREAQFTPIFAIAVADFNLDGNQDAFLAQNFFATRPGVPRIDAGRGLVLLGDGQGGLAPMSATESGVRIYGEQRGAAVADFNHDGSPDVVVTQNGAPKHLFKNNSVKPPAK